MHVSANLLDLHLLRDARGRLGVVIHLDRGHFAQADVTADLVTALVMALSSGSLSLSCELPIPCRAQFVRGHLVALGHPTEERWAIFEAEPEVRPVRSAEDMVR